MNFIEKHKALIITTLIAGTLLLAMFSLSIKKKAEFIAESYYEIEPQTEEEIKELERIKALEELDNATPKTNQAFNEDEEFKEMMRNFKSMNSHHEEEAQETPEETSEDASQEPEELMSSSAPYNSSKTYALNDKERKTFNKANDVLAMHSAKKDAKNSKGNSASSVSFSLSKRTKVKLPPPVYLCETAGKIIVNITVNAQGQVIDTYINSLSSSDNQCLIDTALEYAKNALFSGAERKSQIGSITYYFQGK
ncbi:energy transducer TonB family protein [Psychroserpens algicola]|uniref:Energy transducer TonB n=1 Tax=Psychroserpens algicola TaxID=1719034 RepID=A0ABT0H509_9FLAO|nr:energy transducer TonB [Psychroserpens algicola]MCK8479247.1 energy transducer TonB [Psychroserpens algicola]